MREEGGCGGGFVGVFSVEGDGGEMSGRVGLAFMLDFGIGRADADAYSIHSIY